MKKCSCGSLITRYSKQCWSCYLQTKTIWNKGKKCPQISTFLTGRKRSEESKLKQAISRQGKSYGRKGIVFSEEWRKNLSEAHKGKMLREKHPNWKGGATSIQDAIRKSTKYKEWRLAVFLRDEKTCVLCSSKNNGLINADHYPIAFSIILATLREKYGINAVLEMAMQFPKLWDITNGRTLCVPCHKATENYGFKKGQPAWNKKLDIKRAALTS